MFRTQQILVLAGMVAAVAIIIMVAENPAVSARFHPPSDDLAERLAFALRWLLVPGLCLLAGIGLAANRRFFSADAIDGTPEPASRALEINLRYNRNTLEQVVLAAIAWLGLAIALPQQQLGIIPVMAILFATGRAAFWIGYLVAPWARALGFGLTFYPTAAALLYSAARALG